MTTRTICLALGLLTLVACKDNDALPGEPVRTDSGLQGHDAATTPDANADADAHTTDSGGDDSGNDDGGQ